MNHTTRREALVLIASAAPSLQGQQHQHVPDAPAPKTPYHPRTLNAAEMALAAVLSDLIIPRTETPGASDAGVPEFMDRRLTASPGLVEPFRHGLSLLGPKFGELSAERQIATLTEFSNAGDSDRGRFFRLLKEMTVDGYYSSRAGLVEELGWHGNTFLTEFKGCTHPEHQA